MEQFLKGSAQEVEALLNGQSTMIDWAEETVENISASVRSKSGMLSERMHRETRRVVMTFSRRLWILISGVIACVLSFGIGGMTWACDVAVISASASSTGRPYIMKNFDASDAYQQQVKYFASVGNGGAYLLLYHYDDYTMQLAGDQDARRAVSMKTGSPWYALRCMRISSRPPTRPAT